jgi:hypothetical protein
LDVSASTLLQLETAVHAVLDDWLDPAVEVHAVEIDETQPKQAKRSKRQTNTTRRLSARPVADLLRRRLRIGPRP